MTCIVLEDFRRYKYEWLAIGLVCSFFGTAGLARGAELELVGLFQSKAVLIVDGGAPRTLTLGARTSDGIELKRIDADSVEVIFQGVRHKLVIGSAPVRFESPGNSPSSVTLFPDGQGHFVSQGRINGANVRFLIDTGASMVSLGASDARRLGINAATGEAGFAQTANGVVRVWEHRLDAVSLGGITLYGVRAIVHENDLPVALLGMSFLNRVEMDRKGTSLTLRKRF